MAMSRRKANMGTIFILMMLVGQTGALLLEGGRLRGLGDNALADGGGQRKPAEGKQVARYMRDLGRTIGFVRSAATAKTRGYRWASRHGEEDEADDVCCCYYDKKCVKTADNVYCALRADHENKKGECKKMVVKDGELEEEGGGTEHIDLKKEGHHRIKTICEAYAKLQAALAAAGGETYEPGSFSELHEAHSEVGKSNETLVGVDGLLDEDDDEVAADDDKDSGDSEAAENVLKAENNIDAVKEKLEEEDLMPNMGKEFQELYTKAGEQIKTLKATLEKHLKDTLENEKVDIDGLQAAIDDAKKAKVTNKALFEEAEGKLNDLKKRMTEAKDDLEKAINSASESPSSETRDNLKNAIEKGGAAGLSDEELKEARELLSEVETNLSKEELKRTQATVQILRSDLSDEEKEHGGTSEVLKETSENLEVAQAQVEDHKGVVSDLKSQIETKDTTIEQLNSDKKDLQSQIETKDTQISEKEKEISDLNSVVSDLKSELETTRTVVSDLKSELETTRTAKEKCENKNQELQTEISDLNSKIGDKDKELETTRTAKEKCENEKDDLQSKNQELQTKNQELQTNVDNLQSKLEACNAEKETCQTELSLKDEKLEACNAEKETCQTKLTTTSGDLETCNAEKKSILKEKQILESGSSQKVTNLEKSHKQEIGELKGVHEQEIKKLKGGHEQAIQTCEKEKEECKKKLNTAEAKLNTAEAANGQLKQQLASAPTQQTNTATGPSGKVEFEYKPGQKHPPTMAFMELRNALKDKGMTATKNVKFCARAESTKESASWWDENVSDGTSLERATTKPVRERAEALKTETIDDVKKRFFEKFTKKWETDAKMQYGLLRQGEIVFFIYENGEAPSCESWFSERKAAREEDREKANKGYMAIENWGSMKDRGK